MSDIKFKSEIEFANYVNELGGVLYLVGGYVRDGFLKRKSNDKDYVITGLDFNNIPFQKVVGEHFPVFIINIDSENCEVALARKEFKRGIGHSKFSFYTDKVTIKEDLFRRDLTINAIARNVLTGVIIDPYNGITKRK
jgi:tRNA nucleotidyltransferase (CCA-adding enzyme)